MARWGAGPDHPRRRRLTGTAPTSSPHLALVGPTASGKSALAAAIASALGDIEIVSLDSMQVYRTLDVGTAKPDAATRAAVTHHLVDVADADEEWSVARTQAQARAAVADIAARGRRALLVGGTGLYVQAVLDDLRLPGEDVERRAALEAETAEPGGVARAYERLQTVDPTAAARIDAHNARRIVRALEVIEVTGQPFSSFGPGVAAFGPTAFPVRVGGVWLPRDVLATRIGDRVEAMRDAGLVGEVEAAVRGPGLSRTARQAIGYREVADALDAGHPVGPSEFDAIVRRTRSFARRQRMWFRRDPRITWYASPDNPCRVLPALLAAWSG